MVVGAKRKVVTRRFVTNYLEIALEVHVENYIRTVITAVCEARHTLSNPGFPL